VGVNSSIGGLLALAKKVAKVKGKAKPKAPTMKEIEELGARIRALEDKMPELAPKAELHDVEKSLLNKIDELKAKLTESTSKTEAGIGELKAKLSEFALKSEVETLKAKMAELEQASAKPKAEESPA
jgi:outer membrane murein-binding lipoprotein Lpp